MDSKGQRNYGNSEFRLNCIGCYDSNMIVWVYQQLFVHQDSAEYNLYCRVKFLVLFMSRFLVQGGFTVHSWTASFANFQSCYGVLQTFACKTLTDGANSLSTIPIECAPVNKRRQKCTLAHPTPHTNNMVPHLARFLSETNAITTDRCRHFSVVTRTTEVYGQCYWLCG